MLFGQKKQTRLSPKFNNKLQKIIHSDVRQSTTKKILATIFAILIAFFLALIIACSVCQTWGQFGKVLGTVFSSGFKNIGSVNSLLSNMAILIVGGLAFIFAYKAGLFNIGISGQMVAGATAATLVSHLCGLGSGANQIVILIISMGVGALVAALVGALKAYLRINEVVSSIMFNWIIYFMSILILSLAPIAHDASNLNTLAPDNSVLLRINGNSFGPLIILAGVSIIFVAVVLNFTVFGRKQRVTGLSNSGALAAGYNVKANMIASMAISGALAGLLGVMVYCGFSPNMPVTAAAKAIPQEGFNGISVGLISMCSPVASIPVSLFFAMVKTSVSDLQILGIDNHIADVVFGIVVYGAAAITLFLNLKPYWLTLDIFRGKNYSKIKHERNMSNIELLSIAGDQCAILRQYFVYYQKHSEVPSTMQLKPGIKIKMWWGGVRYWFVDKEAKLCIWHNKKVDLFTGKKFYKQEMAHIIKKNDMLYVDMNHKKCGGWYVKLSDKVLASPELKTKINQITKTNCNAQFMIDLATVNKKFKDSPFNPQAIEKTALLAYLQNLRTGLRYRIDIARQNKLVYFTLQQTKQQAEAIGLAEIRSKDQYNFARLAYFKAYQRTFDIVKSHYDTMVKTFGRGKQLNIYGIRFDSATLNLLYIKNLKEEIASISHLINCPLTKAQLNEVGGLVSKVRDLEEKIDSEKAQGLGYKQIAKNYLNKSKQVDDQILVDKNDINVANTRIASIVAKARNNEKVIQHEKWMAQEAANEQAERELRKYAEKRAKRQAKEFRKKIAREQKEALRASKKGVM